MMHSPYHSSNTKRLMTHMILGIASGQSQDEVVNELLDMLDPDYQIKQACKVLGIPFEKPKAYKPPRPVVKAVRETNRHLWAVWEYHPRETSRWIWRKNDQR